MDFERQITTRRSVILAGSAQAILALRSDGAFGQVPPKKVPEQPSDEVLDRTLARTQFNSAANFIAVFNSLFVEKLELGLATVTAEAQSAISNLAAQAQNVLLKEFGADRLIPTANLRVIIAGTIFTQNIIIASSTDLKSGLITVTLEKFQSLRDYYCSFYPYCK